MAPSASRNPRATARVEKMIKEISMRPRNNYLLEYTPVWMPVNVDDGTTATGGKNYALQLEHDGKPYECEWSKADVDKFNELVDRCWTLRKKEAPVKKEVNVDAWKEVFATSAAGS